MVGLRPGPLHISFIQCLRRKAINLDNANVCINISRSCSAGAQPPKRQSGRAFPERVEKWRLVDWRSYAIGSVRVPVQEDGEFKAMLIPGHSPLPMELDKRIKAGRQRKKKKVPRTVSMKTDQDWTKIWPAARTFNWSSVPFPLRQGSVRRRELDGIPPGKYANVELLKIPNFLHLTPTHIKKHCAALKKFCTPWPTGLDTDEACEKHLPLEMVTRDYLVDSPSIRDTRARVVTLKIKISSLSLDEHARDKLLKLVGERYDAETDLLTLEADRCPMKHQNYDYTQYLLTALYHESWKKEAWENDETEGDMRNYIWEITQARNALTDAVQKIKDANKRAGGTVSELPQPLQELPDTPTAEDVERTPAGAQYREALAKIHNEGEDVHSLDMYKNATKKLLLNMS